MGAALAVSGCSAPRTTLPVEMQMMMSNRISSLYIDDSGLCIYDNGADCIMMMVQRQGGLKDVRLPEFGDPPGGGRIRMIYCNIETRYVVSWLFHLSDMNVRVVRNQAGEVRSGKNDKTVYKYAIVHDRNRNTQDSYLNCWNETSGPWYDKVMATLLQRYKIANIDSKGRINMWEFIEEVASRNCLSFVFDPKVSYDQMERRVEIESEYESISKALNVMCNETGMEYSIQGGMIYIYPSSRPLN
jgi:hypothetical protein